MLRSGKLMCLVLMDNDHTNKTEFPHLTDDECVNITVVSAIYSSLPQTPVRIVNAQISTSVCIIHHQIILNFLLIVLAWYSLVAG
jgi:hypothetical protein